MQAEAAAPTSPLAQELPYAAGMAIKKKKKKKFFNQNLKWHPRLQEN